MRVEGLWYWMVLLSSFKLIEDGVTDDVVESGLLSLSYSNFMLLVLVELMFGIGCVLQCC